MFLGKGVNMGKDLRPQRWPPLTLMHLHLLPLGTKPYELLQIPKCKLWQATPNSHLSGLCEFGVTSCF